MPIEIVPWVHATVGQEAVCVAMSMGDVGAIGTSGAFCSDSSAGYRAAGALQ